MRLQFAGSSVLVLFGSLTCALVDASAETHSHLRHRNLKECPQVSVLGLFCPTDLDGSVVCKDNCEYGSLCLSAAAGILGIFCDKLYPQLASCPENMLLPCTANLKPVICSSGYQYDNICMAVGAGGMDCEDVPDDTSPPTSPPTLPPTSLPTSSPTECPVPGVQPCPLNIDPVSYGPNDCTYSNPCVAVGAGYTVDECKSVSDIPEPQPGTCPVTSPAVSCINEPDPVICGGRDDDCEYPNLCLAIGAGFQQSDCVSHCPIGNRGIVACPQVLDPILCGGVCRYDNLCSAQTPGLFTEANCESIASAEENEECPDSDTNLICATVFAPAECSGCIYGNGCRAGGAGYSEADCVLVEDPIEVDPIEPLACPDSDPDFICGTVFAPVECNGCIYENGCRASGVGYSEADCVPELEEPIEVNPIIEPLICPDSDPGLICGTIFASVECNGCIYENGCRAGGAGYSEGECVLQVEKPIELTLICPDSAGLICGGTVFAPVECNGCIYENGCRAGGAGYREGECVPQVEEPIELNPNEE
jgi:hypothetical protein